MLSVAQLVQSVEDPYGIYFGAQVALSVQAQERWTSRGKMLPTFRDPVVASATGTAPPAEGMTWGDVGEVAFGAGAAASAIGTFFSVRAEQSRLKSQALSLEHEASMAAINARAAEREAQSIAEGEHRDVAAVTLQAGQDKSDLRTRTGGAGVVVGAGSAGEVQASIDLVKELDVRAIRTNAAIGVASARTRGVNQLNTALLGRVSASNLRRTARGDMAPGTAASASLLTSGSRLWAQWATDRYRSTS